MDSINRVLFDNCIITDSNRGIGIQNRDEGSVSDITFANMTVDCTCIPMYGGASLNLYT